MATSEKCATTLENHFQEVKAIIQDQDMWERVPERARVFSPENLEGLVKFAYFGGFIDMAAVRRLLMADKQQMRQLLPKWYEEIRKQGCWLCYGHIPELATIIPTPHPDVCA